MKDINKRTILLGDKIAMAVRYGNCARLHVGEVVEITPRGRVRIKESTGELFGCEAGERMIIMNGVQW